MLSAMEEPKYKFPYDICDVDAAINAELLQYFQGERTGFVQVGPERYFFPSKYKAEAEQYYNFVARPDDIWITTVPRSGTTWTQELIWLVANELNFEQAKKQPLTERFPFFEFPLFMHDAVKAEFMAENSGIPENLEFIEHVSRPGYQILDELPHNKRRFIKTHFPFSLLPPSVMANKCKVIYVARNPKDVAVSYYHLNRLFRTQGYIGDFERYWRYFKNGLNPWLPYYSHIKEAKLHCQLPNVLLLNYEDMLCNLPSAVQTVATFLDCTLSETGLEQLLQHLSIENFRENKSVNMHQMASVGILNKGEAGFVRSGAGNADSRSKHSSSKKEQLQKEFVTHPKLLANANEWIQQNA